MRERILETALKMFSTYGIKSITMQDIARECGISKKTVYEHFADKTELVAAFSDFLINTQCTNLESYHTRGRDAIEELVLGLRQTEMMVKSINPILFFEMEKYHHSAWKKLSDFKHQVLTKSIRENLERGIREGVYRSNLNINVLTQLRLIQMDSAFNPTHFPHVDFDIHEVVYEITAHFIHGIATAEGHRLLEEYMQQDLQGVALHA